MKKLRIVAITFGLMLTIIASVFSQESDEKVESFRMKLEEIGAKQLIKEIKKEPPERRKEGVLLLGELKNSELANLIVTNFLNKKSEVSDVRCAAATALGKIGEDVAVEPLTQIMLKDENRDLQSAAALALGDVKNSQALKALIEIIQNREYKTNAYTPLRITAAEALGNLGDPAAVAPLISVLESKDYAVQPMAAFSLGEIGDPKAVDPLIKILGLNSWSYLNNEVILAMRNAVVALGKLKDERAIEPLLKAGRVMKDGRWSKDTILGSQAVKSLLLIGVPVTDLLHYHKTEVREYTLERLDSMNWQPESEREKAAYLLAMNQWDELTKLGEPAVESLSNALAWDPESCRKALVVLDSVASPKAMGALVEFYTKIMKDTRYGEMKIMAREILLKMNNPTDVEALMKVVYCRHTELAYWAKAALIELKDPKAEKVYIKMYTEDVNPQFVIPAAKILVEIGKTEELVQGVKKSRFNKKPRVENLAKLEDPGLVMIIVDNFLKDQSEDEQVRMSAVKALSEIGDERAIEPLINAMNNDASELVRGFAALHLGDFNSPKVVGPLIEALKSHKDKRARSFAAKSLGQIGDQKAVTQLITTAKADPVAEVRNSAKTALLKFNDPSAVDVYIDVLNSEDRDMRMKAAVILLDMKSPEASEVRARALNVIEADSPITVVTQFNNYGRPAYSVLKNVVGKEIAKRRFLFNQYNPTKISVEITTDLITGDDIYTTKYDESGQPKNPVLLCLDSKGNILVSKKSGKPVGVKKFTAQQEAKFENVYDGSFMVERNTKIYPCKDCAEKIGIKDCKYVW